MYMAGQRIQARLPLLGRNQESGVSEGTNRICRLFIVCHAGERCCHPENAAARRSVKGSHVRARARAAQPSGCRAVLQLGAAPRCPQGADSLKSSRPMRMRRISAMEQGTTYIAQQQGLTAQAAISDGVEKAGVP